MPRLPVFVVRKLLARNVDAATSMDVAEMRAHVDKITRKMRRIPGVEFEPTTLGGLAAEWARPLGAAPGHAILFVHGGGYQLGSIDSHRDLASRIARAARIPSVAIAYRLAPEHPFPAALDDVEAAYRALVTELGFDAGKVAIVGDSAGGGLAIAAALRIRDRHDLRMPGALVALSPWTDLTCTSESLNSGHDPTVRAEYVKRMADAYLAGTDPRKPEASPYYAELAGLPAILLQVGTQDALLDDTRSFAERCRNAEVDVTLQLCDGMFHAFQLWGGLLKPARDAIDDIAAFVRAKTGC